MRGLLLSGMRLWTLWEATLKQKRAATPSVWSPSNLTHFIFSFFKPAPKIIIVFCDIALTFHAALVTFLFLAARIFALESVGSLAPDNFLKVLSSISLCLSDRCWFFYPRKQNSSRLVLQIVSRASTTALVFSILFLIPPQYFFILFFSFFSVPPCVFTFQCITASLFTFTFTDDYFHYNYSS